MLARNATIFTFSGITPDAIDAAVARRPFSPCGASEASSRGFIPPVSGMESLIRFAGNVAAIAMREDDKILPACVVQAETKRRNDEAARAAALRAEAAAIGAELDPESIEQGDHQ